MKINKSSQIEQKKEFNQNLSFEECLDYFSKEPSQKEFDDMQKQSRKVSNNPFYQPLQGA